MSIVLLQLVVCGIFFLAWCLRKWLRDEVRGMELKELAELAILYFALLGFIIYLIVAINK